MSDALIAEIQSVMQADRSSGSERPLRAYLDLFPDSEIQVIMTFAELFEEEPAPSAEGAAPHRIGPYEIDEVVGRGGQGVVYRAHDDRLGRTVALKVLAQPWLVSEHGRQRFRREAEVASSLSHPGLCAVLDFGTDEGVAYIAMPFIKGKTLADRITQGRGGQRSDPAATELQDAGAATATGKALPDRSEVLRIVRAFEELAHALHEAHEAGIVHRDVKSSNIMLRRDGSPVLLDFGLARSEGLDLRTLTMTGDLIGTPAYMSPEQLSRGEVTVDRRTDIYSLGVALHEALTLELPFEAPTREGLYHAILTREPRDPVRANQAIHRDLKTVIQTAIARDRDGRYQTAADLAGDLRRVRDKVPVMARPIGAWTRAARWSQRNPAVAASLSLAAIILVAALVVSLNLLSESRSNERRASRNLAEMRQMSDAHVVQRLLAERPSLFPRREHRVPAMRAWLRDANAIMQRLEGHRRALAAIPSTSLTSDEDAWRRSVLGRLLDEAAALPATIAAVNADLATAQSIRQQTVVAEAAAWKRAHLLLRHDPAFADFELESLVGLVPLGRDRDSQRLEFWHVESGERPEWHGEFEAGKATPSDRSGLVFVLLPGGSFFRGAQREDPAAPNHDPQALAREESPVRKTEVQPFFVSKFEVTQWQWELANGTNPSRYHPGKSVGGRPITARNPVTDISWQDAQAFGQRYGLRLPTESQWEYAARAGTTTPFSSGQDVESLRDHANLADEGSRNVFPPGFRFESDFEDGHAVHAPVGSYRANPWGLHDVHGNVWEWCRERVSGDPHADEAHHDSETPESQTHRICRGGCFFFLAVGARSAFRHRTTYDVSDMTIGFRPVLEP